MALLWAVAAIHKALDPRAFREIVVSYQLTPSRIAPYVATTLIAIEGALAISLVVPASRTTALSASAVLLAIYSSAIAINLARGRRHIDCGCMGPATAQPLSGWLLLRNATLMLLSFAALLPASPRPLVWLDALSCAAAVAFLALTYTAVDGLIANAPSLSAMRTRARS